MDITEAYKFCPRCGAKFAERLENHMQCPACGLSFYVNSKACTSITLQNEQGEYLLVKRAVEPQKGAWDLPGGFVERDEDFETAARRETEEELGISIGELEYIGSFEDNYLYQNVWYPTVTAAFKAKVPRGADIKPADDVASFQFMTAKDIPLDELAFPSIRKVLEMLTSGN